MIHASIRLWIFPDISQEHNFHISVWSTILHTIAIFRFPFRISHFHLHTCVDIFTNIHFFCASRDGAINIYTYFSIIHSVYFHSWATNLGYFVDYFSSESNPVIHNTVTRFQAQTFPVVFNLTEQMVVLLLWFLECHRLWIRSRQEMAASPHQNIRKVSSNSFSAKNE